MGLSLPSGKRQSFEQDALFNLSTRWLATGDCVQTRQNAAISVLFVKFSLEARMVRLRSPSPKFIENIGVLVVGKSYLAFLG